MPCAGPATDGTPGAARWARLEPPLRLAALLLFGLALGASALTSRGLYADGAAFFIQALERGGAAEIWPHRLFVLTLMQLPLDLALRAGITDPALLSVIFTAGCLLPWPLALWLCRRLAPAWSWVVLLAAAAGFLNTAMMTVGEHAPAHAFFWPPVFALLFVRPLTPLAAAALLGCALILVCSYESLLFLGPCLLALALWRVWRGGERGWRRATLLLAALCFLAATGVALWATLLPKQSANFGDFRTGALELLTAPSAQILWTLAWVAAMGLLLLRPGLLDRVPGRLLLAALIAVALAWGLQSLYDGGGPKPHLHHRFRAVNLVVPLALLALVLWLRRRPAVAGRARPVMGAMAAAALAIQSLWLLGGTLQWWGYLGAVRAILAEHAGAVDVIQTPLDRGHLGAQSLGFVWDWTLPALSIALADGGRVTAILYHPRSLPHWDLRDPAALPALARYGIDYRPYLAALAEQR